MWLIHPPQWDLDHSTTWEELAAPTVPAAPKGTAPVPPGPDPGDERCPAGSPGRWHPPRHSMAASPRLAPRPAADSAINHGDTSSGQDGDDDRDHPSACHPRRAAGAGGGPGAAAMAAPLPAAPRGQGSRDDGGGSWVFALEAVGKLWRWQRAQQRPALGPDPSPGGTGPRAALAPALRAAKREGCRVLGWRNGHQSEQKVYSTY